MESKIGLLIQFTGVLLLTVLSLFLRRSLQTAAATYWSAAWASLCFALLCLSLAFVYNESLKLLYCLYLMSEYAFCLLLICGCRALSEDFKLTRRRKLIFLPLMGVAVCLTFLADDFRLLVYFHVFLMAVLFAVALWTLRRRRLEGLGWRMMNVALGFLVVNFLSYFAIYSLSKLNVQIPLPPVYMAFSPIIDLVLEIMLGFGMVIVLLEQLLQKMRKVNEKLHEAHERLERTAHTDPLTTALNRHAFYGFVSKSGAEQASVSGCVGFFDIDDLKPINDQYGHAVGDLAIRSVVSAIRNLIRAEDLIYRWGGDEFFVLLVSMDEDMARERMKSLAPMLTEIEFDGAEMPLTLTVSYGFKDFSDISDLDRAIKAADQEMYRFKQERKQKQNAFSTTSIIPAEHSPSTYRAAKII